MVPRGIASRHVSRRRCTCENRYIYIYILPLFLPSAISATSYIILTRFKLTTLPEPIHAIRRTHEFVHRRATLQVPMTRKSLNDSRHARHFPHCTYALYRGVIFFCTKVRLAVIDESTNVMSKTFRFSRLKMTMFRVFSLRFEKDKNKKRYARLN